MFSCVESCAHMVVSITYRCVLSRSKHRGGALCCHYVDGLDHAVPAYERALIPRVRLRRQRRGQEVHRRLHHLHSSMFTRSGRDFTTQWCCRWAQMLPKAPQHRILSACEADLDIVS